MQSSDKPTITTIGEDSHESESEENNALKLFNGITQEEMQNASEMPIYFSTKNQNYEKIKISNHQLPNFQVQSVMPNLFLPSTKATFSPLSVLTYRPDNISYASSSGSMLQTGNIRARPSDSGRERILHKYRRILPSTSAKFSPLCVSTSRPDNISSTSSSASIMQTGNIRARPSDSRERILNKYQRSDKPTFACDICNKTFIRNSQLKMHKINHTDERPFVCEICNKTFRRSSEVKQHKDVHSYERPFACEICNMTFKRKSEIKQHKEVHSDERSFACEICNKTFKRSRELKKHKDVHSDERPFACEICYKTFRRSSEVKQHKEVHSDKRLFECVECNKSYKRKNQLEAHKIGHMEERYFWCDQCNKKFKLKNSLNRHKKQHS